MIRAPSRGKRRIRLARLAAASVAVKRSVDGSSWWNNAPAVAALPSTGENTVEKWIAHT